ncbi:MAG TPA: hypothetical protein VEK79_15870 [Thermoanaerobaculia bacterium]|nr:hypothetical protein [Thermoanaerobaculia bacterium]
MQLGLRRLEEIAFECEDALFLREVEVNDRKRDVSGAELTVRLFHRDADRAALAAAHGVGAG